MQQDNSLSSGGEARRFPPPREALISHKEDRPVAVLNYWNNPLPGSIRESLLLGPF